MADDAWSHSAAAVCDIEGNSSLRMTPAALSPCQRPSAAASTASRAAEYLRCARARYGFQISDEAAGSVVMMPNCFMSFSIAVIDASLNVVLKLVDRTCLAATAGVRLRPLTRVCLTSDWCVAE